MTYPTAITTFTHVTDGVDDVSAALMNAVYHELEAIETELGADPIATGVFTPTIGGSTGDGSVTYSSQQGIYTRIYNVVFFSLRIILDTVTSAPTGNLQIKGLPLTAASAPATFGANLSHYTNIDLAAGTVQLGAAVVASSTYIAIYESVDNNSEALTQGGAVKAGSAFRINGAYWAA